ncbi:MAG: hypothetical protein F4Y28_07155 [Acidimicrobiia bacterium]|nr:hypothetical protein [Acidimicrobiia bacterium]MYG58044.1 hypothetical protein [Acidimicrobiia bacterium]MYJ32533.1 hypothetical protein [Acidimicrobiia bacterium]
MATAADAVSQAAAKPRPLWRRRGARWFAAAVVVAQLALVANGYRDPHNYFAFQPFNESSTYAVELVRVLDDGERVPVPNGRWEGYHWNELIDWGPLRSPWHQRHAFSGVDAVVDFLDNALNWVAGNTPGDTETLYLEATVTYYRNARGPYVTVVRSHERELGGP